MTFYIFYKSDINFFLSSLLTIFVRMSLTGPLIYNRIKRRKDSNTYIIYMEYLIQLAFPSSINRSEEHTSELQSP